MQNLLILCLIPLFYTSCASVMNLPYQKIVVHTDQKANIIFQGDTIPTEKNKIDFLAARQNEDLLFSVQTEDLLQEINIPPENSNMWYMNIPCNYGLGMLVDKNNPKRYGYPHRIFLYESEDGNFISSPIPVPFKGDVFLKFSFPHINHFYQVPSDESPKVNTGFMGLSAGIDYFHQNRQFLNFSASAVSDLFVPVPAPIDFTGEFELMGSTYLSISNNHRRKAYSFGYGFSYGQNSWNFMYSSRFGAPPPSRDPVKKTRRVLGFVFPVYAQWGQWFYLGLIYRPTILSIKPQTGWLYEHLISVDFAWKIKIN